MTRPRRAVNQRNHRAEDHGSRAAADPDQQPPGQDELPFLSDQRARGHRDAQQGKSGHHDRADAEALHCRYDERP
jgi:hypothetical protein